MGMLDRYKKSGGFLQLVQLVETTLGTKREQILKIIHDENPRWAEQVKTKMLTVEKILGWDDQIVADIMKLMNDLTLSVALMGLGKKYEDKVFEFFDNGRKRRIRDLIEIKNPTSGEIAAAYIKIVEEVRAMLMNGSLRFDKLDLSLQIEQNIEDKLASNVSEDFERTSKQITVLTFENKKLQNEIKVLKDKLEQIKKIV